LSKKNVAYHSEIHYTLKVAKFRFVQWLVEWLFSQNGFYFVWDQGNKTKSKEKHDVTVEEIEEVFEMNEALRALGEQISPEANEPRFGILGVTKSGRHLFVCFTLRALGIRIISVRNINRRERKLYEELCKE
jgi:uncharacterized DUF497 family protein